MDTALPLYYKFSQWLKQTFGEKVYRITLDPGFTCPNRDGTKGVGGCTYCVPDSIKPVYDAGPGIASQLEKGREALRARHKAKRFAAYFQINTGTYETPEKLKAMYMEAATSPDVVSVIVSTRPDCVDEEVVSVLKDVKMKTHLWVELGLQSSSDCTLKRVNRGHTAKDFKEACVLLGRAGIDVCAHVMVGLPGETREDVLRTIDFAVEQKVWGVKFHQTQVLKGTRLEEEYNAGDVELLALEQYAETVASCVERLPPDVTIHRLSGEVPRRFLAAPNWGANKFIIADKVEEVLKERGTRQGSALALS